jgi:hypothetical protein
MGRWGVGVGGGVGGGGGACIAAYIIGLGLRVQQTHPSQGKERRGLEGTYFTHLETFVCTTIALKVCEHEIFSLPNFCRKQTHLLPRAWSEI